MPEQEQSTGKSREGPAIPLTALHVPQASGSKLARVLVPRPLPSSPLSPPITEAIQPSSSSFSPERNIVDTHTLQTPKQYRDTGFVELKESSYPAQTSAN